MELLREWQPERVAPLEALMDWVEDEAVVEVVRVEAQAHPVVHLELALAQGEARAHPVVEVVVAEERPQQRWARPTRSVREVKRKR